MTTAATRIAFRRAMTKSVALSHRGSGVGVGIGTGPKSVGPGDTVSEGETSFVVGGVGGAGDGGGEGVVVGVRPISFMASGLRAIKMADETSRTARVI